MDGQTPLHLCNNEGIIELLIDGKAQINATDHRGNTPLHHHLLENHTQIISHLLTAKANVNQLNHEGVVPLHCVRTKSTSTINLLLAAKADIHSPQPETFKTILHRICEQPTSISRVKSILEANADPNKKDKLGRTPLFYACQEDNLEVIELSVYYGADINAKDNNGSTPLIRVIERSRINIWRFLVNAGADVNSTNSKGKSARALAEERDWYLVDEANIRKKRGNSSLDDEDDSEDDEDDDSEEDETDLSDVSSSSEESG